MPFRRTWGTATFVARASSKSERRKAGFIRQAPHRSTAIHRRLGPVQIEDLERAVHESYDRGRRRPGGKAAGDTPPHGPEGAKVGSQGGKPLGNLRRWARSSSSSAAAPSVAAGGGAAAPFIYTLF